MLRLRAGIRAPRESHETTSGLETRELLVEGEDFKAARSAVDEQLPTGWTVLWVRTEKDD